MLCILVFFPFHFIKLRIPFLADISILKENYLGKPEVGILDGHFFLHGSIFFNGLNAIAVNGNKVADISGQISC